MRKNSGCAGARARENSRVKQEKKARPGRLKETHKMELKENKNQLFLSKWISTVPKLFYILQVHHEQDNNSLLSDNLLAKSLADCREMCNFAPEFPTIEYDRERENAERRGIFCCRPRADSRADGDQRGVI